MKSNYLLIDAAEEITLQSKFYKVPFGISAKDKRDLIRIKKIARQKGFYFELWTNEVAIFVHKIAESLAVKVLDLDFSVMVPGQVIKLYNEGKNFSDVKHLTRSSLRLRYHIDTNFRISYNINVSQRAVADKRKKPKFMDDER